MTTKSPAVTVRRIHFEDFDWREFEKLVFAYLLRTDDWHKLEWYGQTGSDSGRDIWGIREDDTTPNGQKVCIQCANRERLTGSKINSDIEGIVKAITGVPDKLLIVARGVISATLRDTAKQAAANQGIKVCELWSGEEFEERLRFKTESLLKRFVGGQAFPDTPGDLRAFVATLTPANDNEILALMTSLFDRPAFYTRFQYESSIPAFKKAITDTIEALNTGIHRLRDGTEIRRIPSRHSVSSPEIKAGLRSVELLLCQLRAKYDEYLKTGELRPCGCENPDCPVFSITSEGSRELDRLRKRILSAMKKLYPPFHVTLGWR